MEIKRRNWYIILGILFLSVLWGCPVSAKTKECKIIFVNANGKVSSDQFRDWTVTAEKGEVIRLPMVSKKGYQSAWVLKSGKEEKKYKPGTRYKVKENEKFYLKYYRLYRVTFYSSDGSHKYSNKTKYKVEGQSLKLPPVPGGKNYKGIGWSEQHKGKKLHKPGNQVKVTGNMKFYAVNKKSTSVALCWPNGKVYKNLYTSQEKTSVFPAADVNTRDGDMVLGWSRRPGKTSDPEYYAGDRTPGKTGKYYMVVFPKTMDQKPAVLSKPEGYEHVYIVGDSRTVAVKNAVGMNKPDNLTFVAKSGGGIQWFKKYGYRALIRELDKQPRKSKKAVVMNWGANDLRNPSDYPRYMAKIARKLSKKYNCTMYYMSVNPINSAMIINCRGKYLRTEKQVDDFNRLIRTTLCSGKKKCYTYINSYDHFRKNGWISDIKNNSGVHDGTHYSVETSLRIYDYCIRFLNRAG